MHAMNDSRRFHFPKCHGAMRLLTLAAMFTVGGYAAEWTYPAPDPGQDLKDLSFYVPPSGNDPLPNTADGHPRSVILLIGDGMGFNHVQLARQRALGEDKRLHMERLPVSGVLRTHSANKLVTDSAAASTALACGIKTHNGRIGIAPDGTGWKSILLIAGENGCRTGLVATSTISHATPAGFAARVKSRGMEVEIAAQMLDQRVNLLFGGGRKYWLPEPVGVRTDGRNLIAEARAAGYQVAYDQSQLGKLAARPALGLFADDPMTTFSPEPMLSDMSRAAIRILSTEPGRGKPATAAFFMMIEGSQIDWAGHANDADNTIRQTLLFDMAVKEALDFALRDRKTLVIVTADHETGGLSLKPEGQGVSAVWTSKDHTSADVPIHAYGPGSIHFSGTHDITDIPKIIARLMDLGEFPRQMK
jgi:alkaline phosphatase